MTGPTVIEPTRKRGLLFRALQALIVSATAALVACGHGSGAVPATGPASIQTAPRVATDTQVAQADVVAINVGGSASGTFAADEDGQGGTPTSVTDTINVSAANAAPAAIYQTQRYGPMTYTIPNLTAGASYIVRLHFAETWFGLGGRPGTGQRLFNVTVNGAGALSNFDVYAAAGAADAAVVRDINSTADGNGTITIALTNGSANYAMLNGIEILAGAGTSVPVGSETPHLSDAFVDSAGVNVHLSEYGSLYGNNFGVVQSLLHNSGLRHVRDGITAGNAAICSEDASLASGGIHVDVIATQSTTDVAAWLACVGSAAESLETLNEYDLSGDPNWAAVVRANAGALAGQFPQLPLVAPALTSEGAFAAVGSLGGSIAFGNAHTYTAGRNPGTTGWGGTDAFGTYGSLAWNLGIATQVSGTKPIYVTEAGFSDQNDQYAVPPVTKARYMLRVLLDDWNAGVPRTYIYELVDEGSAPFSHYGLVDSNGNPKPVYTALTNLLAPSCRSRRILRYLTAALHARGAADRRPHVIAKAERNVRAPRVERSARVGPQRERFGAGDAANRRADVRQAAVSAGPDDVRRQRKRHDRADGNRNERFSQRRFLAHDRRHHAVAQRTSPSGVRENA